MKRVATLTDIEKEELNSLYKYGKTQRVRIRSHIILQSDKGKRVRELVDIFGFHYDTICDLITAYNKKGISGLYDLPKSGRPPAMSSEEMEFVLKMVAQDSRNLNLILSELENKFNKKISKITLIRFLKKKRFIWKRMRKSLKKKRNEAAFKFFKNYLNALLKCEDKGFIDVYFFDESGFNLFPTIPYGWIQINEDIELPSSKSKSFSVLGFINRANDFHSYLIEGSVNSDVVIACFDDFAQNLTKQTVVIIDNAPTHTSKIFKDKIKEWESKNLYISYLPTYSPELNIIEILWRFIKYKWINLGAYESYEKLKIEVERILKNIGTQYRINFSTTI